MNEAAQREQRQPQAGGGRGLYTPPAAPPAVLRAPDPPNTFPYVSSVREAALVCNPTKTSAEREARTLDGQREKLGGGGRGPILQSTPDAGGQPLMTPPSGSQVRRLLGRGRQGREHTYCRRGESRFRNKTGIRLIASEAQTNLSFLFFFLSRYSTEISASSKEKTR